MGALYLNITGANPSSELGYGTWSQVAGGRMLVGQTDGDADFDTAEETGGSKTSTALLAHTHNIGQVRDATTGSATTNIAKTVDTSSTLGASTATDSAGSGSSFSLLNPYYVAYIWKRTA